MGLLNPLNIFLRQEIDRMQKVLTIVRITLKDLLLAIEGTIIMSEVMLSKFKTNLTIYRTCPKFDFHTKRKTKWRCFYCWKNYWNVFPLNVYTEYSTIWQMGAICLAMWGVVLRFVSIMLPLESWSPIAPRTSIKHFTISKFRFIWLDDFI